MKLKGKIAVVTGASRGIGYAISELFLKHGSKVYMISRNNKRLNKAVDSLKEKYKDLCIGICGDVSDPKSVRKIFRSIKSRESRLDILVNNAGIGLFKPFVDTTLNDLRKVFKVNVEGVFLCCKEAFNIMKKGAWIVNIGSIVSIKGYENQSVYSASKHAVFGLTKVLAEEGRKYDINVVFICPGGVDTDMAKHLINTVRQDINPSTLMSPEDIANTVLFMITFSDKARIDNIIIRRKTSSPNF